MTTKTIIKKLNQITKEPSDSLKKEVALEALEYGDPKEFLNAVYNYGCVSGWVSSLIYYSDTHKFYDKHYYEIEELREEFEKDT